MELKTINLDSIDTFNRLYGLPTLHPLVSVFDMKDATNHVSDVRLQYGLYAIFLKNGINGSSRNSGAWIFGKVLNLQDENRRYNMDVPS